LTRNFDRWNSPPMPTPTPSPKRVQLHVNGEPHEAAVGSSVADLLATLQIRAEHIAVERNRKIVPRGRFAATRLVAGDRIEIVTFVGGG
jgi:thiamine biosynthesis protein ThiS